MVLRDVQDVLAEYSGLARTVLEYTLIMKRLVDDTKKGVLTAESWAPLEQLVAVDEFERVGNFKEVMNWRAYVKFLERWMPSAEWDCSFKRVTEIANKVFLELEERTGAGGTSNAVNSVSIYEFDETGKIRHLDIYLQMALPAGLLPAGYLKESP